jgi:hypothetical protein
MASAIAAAQQRINDVGADGDLDGAAAHGEIDSTSSRSPTRSSCPTAG